MNMLDGTRTFGVLAFAEELIADPMALAAYGAAFGEQDDATLVLYAPGRSAAEVVPALTRQFEAVGISPDAGPDMIALIGPSGGKIERALLERVGAVYSRRVAAPPFAALPRYDLSQIRELRALACPSPDAPADHQEGPVVAVVMCVWQRIEFLPTTLTLLQAQVGVRPEVHLWINNPSVASAAQRMGRAASIPVRAVVSERNIGGIGRFHLARDLAAHHPYIVFIDDDQVFDQHAIRALLESAGPRTIASQYAFQLECGENYWHRRRPRPGDWVQYAGTGGMVADASIFADPRVLACPAEFTFVEDLWLSHLADHELGWRLIRSGAQFRQLVDGRDQYEDLFETKSRFLRHLVTRGWQVPARYMSPDAWVQPLAQPCPCEYGAAAAIRMA
jgi:hypothetical protein